MQCPYNLYCVQAAAGGPFAAGYASATAAAAAAAAYSGRESSAAEEHHAAAARSPTEAQLLHHHQVRLDQDSYEYKDNELNRGVKSIGKRKSLIPIQHKISIYLM